MSIEIGDNILTVVSFLIAAGVIATLIISVAAVRSYKTDKLFVESGYTRESLPGVEGANGLKNK